MSEKEGFHELKVSPESEIKALRAFLEADQSIISYLKSELSRLKEEEEQTMSELAEVAVNYSLALVENNKLRAETERLKAREGAKKALLRELSMRGRYAFPENDQDSKWHNQGTHNSGDFMIRLWSGLELTNEDFSPEGEEKKDNHMKCNCTSDETTGWIQTKCCNICGKHAKEDNLNKE